MKNETLKNYFPALTGMRAIAAYMVFFHHYVPSNEMVGAFLNRFFAQGYIGVSVFFVLSGFLIHQRYGDSIQFTKKFFSQYLINRFARIYPLYLFLCLVTLYLAKEKSFRMWFINLTLTKGFFSEWKFVYIAQAWSLTVEECFYFFAPIIFWLINRKRFNIPTLTVLFATVGLAFYGIGQVFTTGGFFGSIRFITLYTFFGRAFDFLVGIYFSQELIKIKTGSKTQSNYITYKGFLLFFSTILVFAYIALRNNDSLAIHMLSGVILSNWVLPIFIGIMLLGLCLEKTPLSKVLGSYTFEVLGKSSYAFYLVHMGLIERWLKSYTSSATVKFIVLNVIAVFLFYLFEAPMNNLIRRRKDIFSELQLLLETLSKATIRIFSKKKLALK